MSTKYLPHIVEPGDRIDKLSQKYYGRVDNVEPIYSHNRQLKFNTELDDHIGTEIIIPIEENNPEPVRIRPGIRGIE